MHDKIKLTIIFGGKSAEHNVSIESARSILSAINKEKYDVRLIGIDQSGKWCLNEASYNLLTHNNTELLTIQDSGKEVTIIPSESKHTILEIHNRNVIGTTDIVFPVLHGSNGEDGAIQGFLKMLNIPFVGAGILGSAIGIDKETTKRLSHDGGVKVAKYLTYTHGSLNDIDYKDISKKLGLPFFVKPSSLGSSVGVHKVNNEQEFIDATQDAFQFDKKILIEENIVGREIECAVLGNGDPEASVPGEIIPKTDFYSYESKYIDENGAILEIPAKLSPEEVTRVQNLAIKVFKLLYCEGMARVDFFLTDSGELILNEINTIPGFTKISMYPKLWEISGLSYPDLIDRLIELAFERHNIESKLKYRYDQ